MKNLANTPPPEFIKVGETIYPINFNFMTWIDVIDLLDEIDFDALFGNESDIDLEEDYKTIEKIEKLVFGSVINEDIYSVLKAVTGFACGYQRSGKIEISDDDGKTIFDFKMDMNAILLAIRNQSGIDLTKPNTLFHWWLFLAEFHSLAGEHYICKLMELRAYNGDDKEKCKARNAVALPPKVSKRQQKFEDEMSKIFYNC